MKITNIKRQVKRPDRCSVFIDGEYSFALSEEELLNQGLKAGMDINEKQLAELKGQAVIDKGIYRILTLISRRPRSKWEIEDYLRRKSYKPEEVEKIVDSLDGKGQINDLEFARRWVENRRLLKATSKRKLQLELRQKRVEDDIIRQVLDEDDTDEQTVLRELIKKKRQQSRYKDEQKLTAYLARQGFNYEDIKAVIKERED